MPTENKQNTPLVEECTMIPGNQVNRGKEKEEVLWRVSNQDKMILKEMDKIRGISLDLIYKVKRLYLKEWLIWTLGGNLLCKEVKIKIKYQWGIAIYLNKVYF